MKKFADESGSDGFIYISFGSAAQISKAKPEFQRTFLNALRKSKTRFILKWESDRIPNEMPTNVYTAKWMPQKDILGKNSHATVNITTVELYFADEIIVL